MPVENAPRASSRRTSRKTKERRASMAAWLREREGSASVADLTEEFGVSEATIRRDLRTLEGSGELLRVFGGAAASRPVEFGWREKGETHAAAKQRIGDFAAENLVSDGDTVYIDAGTTPAAVARALSGRRDLTVVVGGLAALLELAEGEPKVIVLGGVLRRRSASFLGAQADSVLDHLTPDVSFLGTEFLDGVRGANYPELEQAMFKSRILQRSRRSWIVVDESKFRAEQTFANWVPVVPPAGVVTEVPHRAATRVAIDQLRAAGCLVHLAG